MQSSNGLLKEWEKYVSNWKDGSDEEVLQALHDTFFAGAIAVMSEFHRITELTSEKEEDAAFLRLAETVERKRQEILKRLRDTPSQLNPAWLHMGRYTVDAERN